MKREFNGILNTLEEIPEAIVIDSLHLGINIQYKPSVLKGSIS